MVNDEGVGAGSILAAFVLGALTGAAVALLWAPATGQETREYLSEKSREGRDKAAELARRASDAVNRQRGTLRDAVDRGREAYQQARQGPKEPV